MNIEKEKVVRNRKGFIAALDQSGGSSGKTLSLYGVDSSRYSNDKEMFDLIHDMRKRIITSKCFNDSKIMGVILFLETMNRKIGNTYTANYLWDKKNIVSFLKVDKGLADKENGVQLMKPIPDLLENLAKARERNVFGTKMRSVIYEANRVGIKEVVEQQFVLAKTIFDNGLVPIIEPEVDIKSADKEEIENILKEEIDKQLAKLDKNVRIIFKFSLPTKNNFYKEYTNNSNVLKVVALSGGYSRIDACELLSNNDNVVASFSRALLEGLKENQTDKCFEEVLKNNINEIYEASIK